MTTRGAGDQWMSGERVDGVRFALHEAVEITTGPKAGARGTVVLLLATVPEPRYMLELDAGGHVKVPQSAIRGTPGRSP